MTRSVFLLCFLLGITRLVDCGSLHQTSGLSQSVSGLSKDLFLSLTRSEDSRSQNVVLSPVSIFLALSMLYHGSEGATRSELKTFLNLRSGVGNTRALLQDYDSSRRELNTTIQLANSIYADNSLPVKNNYQNQLQNSLLSGVRQVDFRNKIRTVQKINQWVKNKTNNLITDFINPNTISANTKLLVLNAIYFKANWKYPFHKFETIRSVKFDVTERSEVEVDMMSKSDDILYQSNAQLQSEIISLPYEDENFQMMVFLPHSRDENSIQNLIQEFSKTVDFNEIYSSLKERRVELYLPKFTIGHKSDLVTALESLGVRSMFNPNAADFSRISTESLRVSNILHETKIEVSEEGSEAAGVTGAILDLRTASSQTTEVNVNRPFIFVILDRQHNIPLFIGKVLNPSSEEPKEKKPAELQNLLSIRSGNPEDLLKKDCSKGKYINSEKVYFPCSGDTAPIEEYKKVHGDASIYGVKGEKASLINV